mgnify:CR=1 FL=1
MQPNNYPFLQFNDLLQSGNRVGIVVNSIYPLSCSILEFLSLHTYSDLLGSIKSIPQPIFFLVLSKQTIRKFQWFLCSSCRRGWRQSFWHFRSSNNWGFSRRVFLFAFNSWRIFSYDLIISKFLTIIYLFLLPFPLIASNIRNRLPAY